MQRWKAVRAVAAFWAMACAVQIAGAQSATKSLVIYSPHPVEFINPVVKEFEVETGVKVEIVAAGAGELLKRVESEKTSPLGDVMWGGSRASLENYKPYFDPYRSKNGAALLGQYLDAGNAYTPFTIIPTVLMYNRNLVPAAEVPKSWADLLDSKWKGRIAFADPTLSSSSFEALTNMLFAMGKGQPEDGWPYVRRFVANLGGKLLGGSPSVYKGVADGEYAIGVTFEEAAAKYLRQGAPVGVVYPAEGTVVEADGVAVIKGAKNLTNARLFVDFATSQKVQAKIARALDRRSCRIDVAPAVGLADLRSIRVIPGDFRWSGANKTKILERFKELLIN
jgi:iron(III) transport system substrate-binding protein